MSKGIPTEYGGIRFRSRLEAQWAAFFDLLGWRWEYEPFDLSGYIPDFTIPNPIHDVPGHKQQTAVVDVKPIGDWAGLAWRGTELLDCGWDGNLIVVGTSPIEHPWYAGWPCLGHLVHYWSSEMVVDFPERVVGLHDSSKIAPKLAKNKEAYARVAHANPVQLVRCVECERTGHYAQGQCMFCGIEFVVIGRDPDISIEDRAALPDSDVIDSLWATTKNRVQ